MTQAESKLLIEARSVEADQADKSGPVFVRSEK